MTNANFIPVVFASGGDRATIPATSPSDGSLSQVSGYGYPYQLDPTTDSSGLYIERDKFNQLIYLITGAIQRLQLSGGATDFVAASDNNSTAITYPAGATVWYNGVRYVSLASNTDQDPSASSNWLALVQDYLPRAGGTMTGPLILSQDATAARGAVALEQLTAAINSLTASINSVYTYAQTRAAADGNYSWQLVLTDGSATNTPAIRNLYGTGFYRWTKMGAADGDQITGQVAIFNGNVAGPAPEYYNPQATGGAYNDDVFHFATQGVTVSGSIGSDYTFNLYKLMKSA